MWIERLSEATAFTEHDRLWWGYLASAAVIAVIVATLGLHRSRKPLTVGKLVRNAFALHFWRKPTTWVDLKVALANWLFEIPLSAATAGMVAGAALLTATAFGGTLADASSQTYGVWTCALVTLLIVAARDFSTWVSHALRHTVPALWAFHRVHHSAERLTPLTVRRQHPVEDIVKTGCDILIAGPLQGLIAIAFGGLDFWLLFGGNAIFAIFNAAVGNFRHSHVWIHWPAPFSLIFSSPAQHQIHHSRLAHHWDRNYGEIFALWDWMFGTLYNPTKPERMVFGLSPEFGVERPRPHQTLTAALVEPFTFMARKRAEAATATPPLLPPRGEAQPAQSAQHAPHGRGIAPVTLATADPA